MTATTIHTLDFARKLRAGGVDERTANTIAQEVGHFVADNAADKSTLATKDDFTEFKSEVRARLTRMETNQRWQQWALGFIIAVQIGVVWNLFAISQKLAAISAHMPPP
jgi:hypothetical protein